MKQRTHNGWTRRPTPMYRHPFVVLGAVIVFGVIVGLVATPDSSPELVNVQQPAYADDCGGLISGRVCRLDNAIEAATR